MKKIPVLLCILFFTCKAVHAQSCTCGSRMYYRIEAAGFETYYYPICVNVGDTVKESESNSHFYKCVFSDCKGAMQFFGYTNFRLSSKGNYINSIDTLKGCSFVSDPLHPDAGVKPELLIYFQPLRDGEWTYYDDMGEIILIEHWKAGVLIDSEKVDPK